MATTSMNGFTLIDTADLATIAAGGLTTRVRVGAVATVLQHVACRFHAEVETLATFHGWRSVALNTQIGGHPRSNHPSGTAIDCNGGAHPRFAAATFTAAQVAAIRDLLADCAGVVRWGGDFGAALVDEMHFEIVGSPEATADLAARLTAVSTSEPAGVLPTTPTTRPEEDDMRLIFHTGEKSFFTVTALSIQPLTGAAELSVVRTLYGEPVEMDQLAFDALNAQVQAHIRDTAANLKGAGL
ncbi:hypothetical protein AGMMS50218_03130 [Actinomycetota bacterium]|nr:hypothetical protein AGMMS50218_03130 [Actinomycetota bacterium]